MELCRCPTPAPTVVVGCERKPTHQEVGECTPEVNLHTVEVFDSVTGLVYTFIWVFPNVLIYMRRHRMVPNWGSVLARQQPKTHGFASTASTRLMPTFRPRRSRRKPWQQNGQRGQSHAQAGPARHQLPSEVDPQGRHRPGEEGGGQEDFRFFRPLGADTLRAVTGPRPATTEGGQSARPRQRPVQ